jgi:hypothetical protein
VTSALVNNTSGFRVPFALVNITYIPTLINLVREKDNNPLNVKEDAATKDLLLNAIERQVAQRNKINHSRIELGNAVPASEVYDQVATVSLIIPSEYRKSGNQGSLWHESFSILLGVINLSLNTALSRDGFSTTALILLPLSYLRSLY